MSNGEGSQPQADQVILTARYSGAFFWSSQMAVLLGIGLVFYAAYVYILRGQYVPGVILLLGDLYLLQGTLLGMLTEIVFYQDRVVRVWRLFGQRTIYYSRAQVKGPSFPWPQKGYQIKEIKEDGKVPLNQMAISFNTRLLPPHTVENIAAIFDYLTEDTKNYVRRCRKVTLPEEVICPEIPGHLNPPVNPADATNAEDSTRIPRISGTPYG